MYQMVGTMQNGGVARPRHSPAMWFDGIDDYLDCGNDDRFDISTLSAFTIYFEYSLEPQDPSGSLRVLNRGRYRAFGWEIVASRTSFIFRTYTDGSSHDFMITGNQQNDMNKCCIRCNGIDVILDYNSIRNQLNYVSPMASANTLYIGRYLNLNYNMHGVVKGIRLYSRVLSNAEYQSLCRGKSIDNTGLVGYWQGNGITDNDWRNRAGDYGHGTIYGNPERCLVHRRGAVVRTDEQGQRYIVR